MKIAIVYNHDFQNVINLFGIPNKKKIGQDTIKRIANLPELCGLDPISKQLFTP